MEHTNKSVSAHHVKKQHNFQPSVIHPSYFHHLTQLHHNSHTTILNTLEPCPLHLTCKQHMSIILIPSSSQTDLICFHSGYLHSISKAAPQIKNQAINHIANYACTLHHDRCHHFFKDNLVPPTPTVTLVSAHNKQTP